MREILRVQGTGKSVREGYEQLIISKTARGVSDAALNNCRYHTENAAHGQGPDFGRNRGRRPGP